ncbi:MAG: DUF4848 domain-containing protein [Prolixibacteraceae bacterium]|jgi:hypothetical protein|nr:DUF4848 domain-containing protein [Prolixibacteraceae bacterium]
MKKLMFLAVIAMVLTVFNACQKDGLEIDQKTDLVATEKPDVYLENDYLVFKNMTVVDSVMNLLSKMTRNEKDVWESNFGFKSARVEFEKLFDEYEQLNSMEEFLAFKKRNLEKLKFNNLDPEDCSIDYPFVTTYLAPVLNANGVCKVGNSLNKFTMEDQIVILDGDLKKLKNIETYRDDKVVYVFPKLKSTSSTDLIDDFPDDDPSENEDRWWTDNINNKRRLLNELKIYRYVYTTPNPNGGPYLVKGYEVYLEQRAQKRSWGSWNDYNTTYVFENASFKINDQATSYPPTGTSPEVRPSYRWDLKAYYKVTPYEIWMTETLLGMPQVSLQADVSCRGFDGTLYPLDHIEHSVFP